MLRSFIRSTIAALVALAVVPSIAGAQYVPGPRGMTGPQGEKGTTGAGLISGAGAPSNGTGSNGDFYVDTVNYRIYGPKTGGAWGVGSISLGITLAAPIAGEYGGTGVANTGRTITLGGNLVTSGAFDTTFTVSGTTNVTLPTTGTLLTTTGSGASLTSLNASNILSGTLSGAQGGTGVSNSGKTITLGGNLTTSGAFTTTLTVTNNTSVTLPTSGTLLATTGSGASLTGITAGQISGLATSATTDTTNASNIGSGTLAAARMTAMTSTVGGAVPTPPNNTTTFLRGDGTFATPAGSGNVSNTGTPTSGQVAVWTSSTQVQGVDSSTLGVVPSGVVVPYAGTSAPTGWLMAYGQAVSRSTYAALFSAIGTTYGAGDGSTTFNLPDMRGRTAAGKDDMGGSAASRLTNSGTGNPGINGASLGASGGADRHTLTTAQMPAHTHAVPGGMVGGADVSGAGGPYLSAGFTNNGTSGSTGSGDAHPNVQPTIVLNYIIRQRRRPANDNRRSTRPRQIFRRVA